MKKIYNSPEMDIIELKQQQTLLAGSVTFSVTNDVIPANEVDAPIFSDDLPVFGDDGTDLFAE
jgi:hypothetical protein